MSKDKYEALCNELAATYDIQVESKPTQETGYIERYEDIQLGEDGNRISRGGIRYNVGGLPNCKENNPLFRPVVARGNRYDHGKYWQWAQSSDIYTTALLGVEHAIRSGHWVFEYAGEIPEALQDAAQERLDYLNESWTQEFLHQHAFEVQYKLTTGFSLFEKVWNDAEQRLDLEFLYAKQVEKWIVDPCQREWLAVKLHETSEPIPSEKMLLYSHRARGLDLEGNSPLRHVGLLIQIHQDLSRLYSVAAEAYGVPRTYIIPNDPNNVDAGDGQEVVNILSRARGLDVPVIQVNGDYRIETTSPSGHMPDIESMQRYLEERIARVLSAEGVLLGGGTVGSFALADSKDGNAMRQAKAHGAEIASGLTKVIHEVLGYIFDVPDVDGMFPRLRFDLGIEDKKWDAQDLVSLIGAGAVEVTPELVKQVHTRLGLPLPSVKELKDEKKETDTEE